MTNHSVLSVYNFEKFQKKAILIPIDLLKSYDTLKNYFSFIVYIVGMVTTYKLENATFTGKIN